MPFKKKKKKGVKRYRGTDVNWPENLLLLLLYSSMRKYFSLKASFSCSINIYTSTASLFSGRKIRSSSSVVGRPEITILVEWA